MRGSRKCIRREARLSRCRSKPYADDHRGQTRDLPAEKKSPRYPSDPSITPSEDALVRMRPLAKHVCFHSSTPSKALIVTQELRVNRLAKLWETFTGKFSWSLLMLYHLFRSSRTHVCKRTSSVLSSCAQASNELEGF